MVATRFPMFPTWRSVCERQKHLWVRLGQIHPDPGLSVSPSHSGMSRLIELCRLPSERNSSDAVLVACLVSSQTSPSFLHRLWAC